MAVQFKRPSTMRIIKKNVNMCRDRVKLLQYN